MTRDKNTSKIKSVFSIESREYNCKNVYNFKVFRFHMTVKCQQFEEEFVTFLDCENEKFVS